jgi:2-amino-4-hydroxy-6-hydroxymethyldihydropteridine diphosphokinase
LYGSAPLQAGGPDYVNAVVAVASSLNARHLLQALHQIEADAGRQRPYLNAPRTLDLDLLLHGTDVGSTAELLLPHPRMGERAFVLRPLAEIAPQRVTPDQLQAVHGQLVWRL